MGNQSSVRHNHEETRAPCTSLFQLLRSNITIDNVIEIVLYLFMKIPHFKKHNFFPLIILATSLNHAIAVGQTDSTKTYSLAKCIEITLKKNILLDDVQKDVELSQAKYLKKNHANFLPRFELRNIGGLSTESRGDSNAYGFLTSPDDPDEIKNLSYFTQTEVKFSQPIYSFNRYTHQAEAAEQDILAKEVDFLKQRNDIQFQVEQLYWGLVMGKELQRVIHDAQEKLSEVEKKLNEKLEAGTGEGSQTDLFKLEISKYELNKRQREADTKVRLARSTLAMALGLSASDSFQIETEYIEAVDFDLENINSYLNQAKQSNPELIKARARVNKHNSAVLAERSQYYPQFYFGGTTTYNFAAGRFDPNNPFVNHQSKLYFLHLWK